MGRRNKFLKEKTKMSKAFIRMTDIHVNLLQKEHLKNWCQYVRRQGQSVNAQGVIISGDISESLTIVEHLQLMADEICLPIYFVMGNHDYWNGSIEDTRKRVTLAMNENAKIKWLGGCDPIPISEKTCVLGHDGWYDTMAGNWRQSHVYMRDWDLVHDFLPLRHDRATIVSMCKKLASESICYVSDQIDKALEKGFETIMIVTHIPPFVEAARHRGQPGDMMALPFYSAKMMGEMILDKANRNQNKRFFVLSGHTHDETTQNISHNVTIHVGGAEYMSPSFQIIYVNDN